MKIQDILNSNLTNEQKLEILQLLYPIEQNETQKFQEGGKLNNNLSEEQIKEQLIKEWPAISNLSDFKITADPDFTKDLTGAGSIEYFRSPEITYRNGQVVKNPNGDIPTLLYNPNDNSIEDIKLDLLHHFRFADPTYQKLLEKYTIDMMEANGGDILYNSEIGQQFRESENNDETDFMQWVKLHKDSLPIEDAIIQGIDGSLRDLLASDELRKKSNYQTKEDAIKSYLVTPELKQDFENIKNYLEGKEVKLEKQGGTLDMTLEEILKLNISDSAKMEFVKAFAKGGEVTESEDNKEELPEPDVIVTVGDKEYKACVADTDEKRHIGLSKCKNLPKDGGMLFVFEEPSTDSFTMAETEIDLDIAFIDEDGEVINVESVKALDPNPVVCEDPYVYVLEVNYGSGIESGDEVTIESILEDENDQDLEGDFTDEEKEYTSQNQMLMLDENGDVQYRLHGGERLCSRIFTRKLIKAAIKAYRNDTESDYRRVGRMIMSEFIAQDNRKQEFVESPEKKGETDGE